MANKRGCLIGVGVVVGMVLLKQACDRVDEMRWQAEAARQSPIQDSLPRNRGASGEADTTYIVCAEPRQELLKTCSYGSGNLSFPVNRSAFDLRLLTKSVDALAKGTVYGKDYECPAQMKRSQVPRNAVDGPAPTAVDIVQWVEKQVSVKPVKR